MAILQWMVKEEHFKKWDVAIKVKAVQLDMSVWRQKKQWIISNHSYRLSDAKEETSPPLLLLPYSTSFSHVPINFVCCLFDISLSCDIFSVYQGTSAIMDSYTLKSVSDLPAPFRSAFNFRYFNSLQSECFPVCFHSDANMVVSAPTGSGKTVLFELCILRLLSRFISGENKFTHIKGTLKTIYVAPSKALVQEKLREWNQKFGSWGISCLELTGDNESYKLRNIQESDIILTTPEKFDAVTRHGIKDGGLSFFSDISLLLIDEVHLLNDPRGAALEAIVSRVKMLARKPELKLTPLAQVRLVAVSATIPNIEDLAEWLEVPVYGIKRFGEEMRPVKLTTKVFGYTQAKNDFLFEKRLQNFLFDILMQYSRGKSALVFCSTRKGAQEAAQTLSQTAMTFGHSNPFIKDGEQEARLREASFSCSDKQMQSYILYGVGYHNGGLCLKDRSLIEGLFLKGDVRVLCTTNTLAHGINLPAHTVVIKSTQHFNKEKGMYMEHDRSTILQMCGRAGRPPFDDTGMVIIMTRRDTVHLYENLLSGCEMVESQLLSCLPEHLTAEIVQLTVTDITKAIEWMKCSYLYVRMKKSPGNYAVRKGIFTDHIEKHLQGLSVQKVNELSRHQLVWTDEDGFLLKPLEPGILMTKYYLKFDTMKLIMQTPEKFTLQDALHVISHAEEIAWIQLRRNEKKLLNDINNDKDKRLRFHVHCDNGKRKKRIQTREEKIFVLVNDCLTGDPSVRDLSLTQDMNSICSNGSRIAKCMKEYFTYKKNYGGTLNSTLLAKSLYQKLWDDSPYLLKQLPGIGMVTAKALHSMEVKSFESLAEADPRRIEIITSRKYPFGNHIKDSLLTLPPKVELKVEDVEYQRPGKSKIVITLTRITQPHQSLKRHYADIIVGSEEENLILFHEKIRVDEFFSPYSAPIILSRPQQGKLTVKADFIFEEYIGIDLHEKLVLTSRGNISLNWKRGGVPPLPHKVCHINDDLHNISQSPTAELHSSTKSATVDSSMPSFNLLDEEFGEDDLPERVKEAEDCRIITEQEIFQHIREKAKNFPGLLASNSTYSPSTETLILAKKRTREKQFEYNSEEEVLEESAGYRFQKQLNLESSSGTNEVKQNGHGTGRDQTQENQITTRSSGISNLSDNIGGFTPDLGNDFNTLSAESIFDHIRKKAKDFPQLNKLKTLEPDYQNETNEDLLNSTSFISKGTESNIFIEDAALFPDLEAVAMDIDACSKNVGKKANCDVHSGSTGGSYGNFKATPRVSSTDVDLSSVEMLSFDISMMKNNKVVNVEGGSMKCGRMSQTHSPSLQQKQCCSLSTTAQIRKPESFLGFESVFSFL